MGGVNHTGLLRGEAAWIALGDGKKRLRIVI
jgi:hypothetical protein